MCFFLYLLAADTKVFVSSGSASALLAAGGGMQTAGYLGMAANHIFENGREAVREARVKKSV